ncbi:hypothetical protein HZA87_03160 [Candidatus Uhrbacteria bacterium]|nr:hypothetical protein [Candidatus Uhrbacteria bacterium]
MSDVLGKSKAEAAISLANLDTEVSDLLQGNTEGLIGRVKDFWDARLLSVLHSLLPSPQESSQQEFDLFGKFLVRARVLDDIDKHVSTVVRGRSQQPEDFAKAVVTAISAIQGNIRRFVERSVTDETSKIAQLIRAVADVLCQPMNNLGVLESGKILEALEGISQGVRLEATAFLAVRKEAKPSVSLTFTERDVGNLWKKSEKSIKPLTKEIVPIRLEWTDEALFADQKLMQLCKLTKPQDEITMRWQLFVPAIMAGLQAIRGKILSVDNKALKDGWPQHESNLLETISDLGSHIGRRFFFGPLINKFIGLWHHTFSELAKVTGIPEPTDIYTAFDSFLRECLEHEIIEHPFVSPSCVSTTEKIYFGGEMDNQTTDESYAMVHIMRFPEPLEESILNHVEQKLWKGVSPSKRHLRKVKNAIGLLCGKIKNQIKDEHWRPGSEMARQWKKILEKVLYTINEFTCEDIDAPTLMEIKNNAGFHVIKNVRRTTLQEPYINALPDPASYLEELRNFYPLIIPDLEKENGHLFEDRMIQWYISLKADLKKSLCVRGENVPTHRQAQLETDVHNAVASLNGIEKMIHSIRGNALSSTAKCKGFIASLRDKTNALPSTLTVAGIAIAIPNDIRQFVLAQLEMIVQWIEEEMKDVEVDEKGANKESESEEDEKAEEEEKECEPGFYELGHSDLFPIVKGYVSRWNIATIGFMLEENGKNAVDELKKTGGSLPSDINTFFKRLIRSISETLEHSLVDIVTNAIGEKKIQSPDDLHSTCLRIAEATEELAKQIYDLETRGQTNEEEIPQSIAVMRTGLPEMEQAALQLALLPKKERLAEQQQKESTATVDFMTEKKFPKICLIRIEILREEINTFVERVIERISSIAEEKSDEPFKKSDKEPMYVKVVKEIIQGIVQDLEEKLKNKPYPLNFFYEGMHEQFLKNFDRTPWRSIVREEYEQLQLAISGRIDDPHTEANTLLKLDELEVSDVIVDPHTLVQKETIESSLHFMFDEKNVRTGLRNWWLRTEIPALVCREIGGANIVHRDVLQRESRKLINFIEKAITDSLGSHNEWPIRKTRDFRELCTTINTNILSAIENFIGAATFKWRPLLKETPFLQMLFERIEFMRFKYEILHSYAFEDRDVPFDVFPLTQWTPSEEKEVGNPITSDDVLEALAKARSNSFSAFCHKAGTALVVTEEKAYAYDAEFQQSLRPWLSERVKKPLDLARVACTLFAEVESKNRLRAPFDVIPEKNASADRKRSRADYAKALEEICKRMPGSPTWQSVYATPAPLYVMPDLPFLDKKTDGIKREDLQRKIENIIDEHTEHLAKIADEIGKDENERKLLMRCPSALKRTLGEFIKKYCPSVIRWDGPIISIETFFEKILKQTKYFLKEKKDRTYFLEQYGNCLWEPIWQLLKDEKMNGSLLVHQKSNDQQEDEGADQVVASAHPLVPLTPSNALKMDIPEVMSSTLMTKNLDTAALNKIIQTVFDSARQDLPTQLNIQDKGTFVGKILIPFRRRARQAATEIIKEGPVATTEAYEKFYALLAGAVEETKGEHEGKVAEYLRGEFLKRRGAMQQEWSPVPSELAPTETERGFVEMISTYYITYKDATIHLGRAAKNMVAKAAAEAMVNCSDILSSEECDVIHRGIESNAENISTEIQRTLTHGKLDMNGVSSGIAEAIDRITQNIGLPAAFTDALRVCLTGSREIMTKAADEAALVAFLFEENAGGMEVLATTTETLRRGKADAEMQLHLASLIDVEMEIDADDEERRLWRSQLVQQAKNAATKEERIAALEELKNSKKYHRIVDDMSRPKEIK